MTFYDYNMLVRVFFQPFIPYHFDMTIHYVDDFFMMVPDLMLKLDRARAKAFLMNVCPVIRGDPEDEAKLRNLLEEAEDHNSPLNKLSFYVDFLRDQLHYVETLEKVMLAFHNSQKD